MSAELTGVDRQVFDLLLERSTSDRAEVRFSDLVPTGVSVREAKEALARLKTTRYVTTLQLFGIGQAGRDLRDQRATTQAAADEAAA